MSSSSSVIAEIIKSLTSEQLVEVENFIEFIRIRGHERELTHSAAAISSTAFEKIWDNPKDSAYNSL